MRRRRSSSDGKKDPVRTLGIAPMWAVASASMSSCGIRWAGTRPSRVLSLNEPLYPYPAAGGERELFVDLDAVDSEYGRLAVPVRDFDDVDCGLCGGAQAVEDGSPFCVVDVRRLPRFRRTQGRLNPDTRSSGWDRWQEVPELDRPYGAR